jgi:hypothetical protein
MGLVDWLVIWILVSVPIGSLWLYAELQSWRDRRRDERRRAQRPGYVQIPPRGASATHRMRAREIASALHQETRRSRSREQ